jgi:hypothetical protein
MVILLWAEFKFNGMDSIFKKNIYDRINRIIWIFCRLTFQEKVNQTNLPSGGRKQSSLSPFAEQFL